MKTPVPHAGPKAPTLKDIAARVGCSVNTASLALRDSPRISRLMRRRIAQAARRLQYIPNSAARNLARKRSGLIGIYTRALYDAVRTELINSLMSELHTAEYRPVLGLGAGHQGPWHTAPWVSTFMELKVEALVVVIEGVSRLPRWPHTVPMVLVGCQPNPGLPCDYVALDRREGARLGLDHLLARGHRNILVGCSPRAGFGRECFDVLRTHGLKPCQVPTAPPSANPGIEELVHHVLASRDRPTAAIFGDSPLAVRFIHRITAAGFRVPGDLAVVGYDYFPWADMLKVPLTAIEQPIREMAGEAIRLVRSRLRSPGQPFQHIVLPHKLVVRQSA